MRGVRRTLGLVAAVVTAVASTGAAPVAAGTIAGEGTGTVEVTGHVPEGYFDLEVLPEPQATGEDIVDGLDAFVSEFPYRLTGGPTETLAGESIRDEMHELGYEAAIEELTVVPGVAKGPLKVVTAVKEGRTRPDEWIMFVGHYDTVPTTIWGAYDNGAGTNLMRFLARELADVPTNRSIVFAWYNGEEEGLLASQRHASALSDAGQDIAAVLGFDMVGIAWPVGIERSMSCLCMFHGPADRDVFRPLLEHVNFGFLGFPNNPRKVTVAGTNSRNSDERRFADEGYRTLRWAGMRTAGSYPAYHLPHDTLDTMIEVAGGREYLEEGTRNTLVSAYYTALALDNHPPVPTFAVNDHGDGSFTFDASGTVDADGAVGDLTWDLGDGTAATGEQVTHTYAGSGTYQVTLTAHDDLWPEVARTATRTVTAG